MEFYIARYSRRQLLNHAFTGAAFLASPGAFAEALTQTRILTPSQTEGPFYPDKLPLDTDNDLIVVNDSLTPAVGEVSYVSGRILNARGEPIRGALVEIWQCDTNGNYRHSRGANPEKTTQPDTNFQSFGRFLTGASGEYLFRTIKPVPYPGRTPHIHYAVKLKGEPKFTTQCYIKGHPLNERDGVLRGIRDIRQRESVIVPFEPLKGAKAGELSARFDIVLGYTPKA
jgi:protocatechuate 3,4-dioxygenase, beta subunit